MSYRSINRFYLVLRNMQIIVLQIIVKFVFQLILQKLQLNAISMQKRYFFHN
jgi:hypothetical protein